MGSANRWTSALTDFYEADRGHDRFDRFEIINPRVKECC